MRSGPLVAAALAACGTGSYAPFQDRIGDQGGPTLTAPQLVTVSYADAQNDVAAIAAAITGPDWLPLVGPEYGIGAASVLAAYVVPGAGPAALADADVQRFLQGLIAAGSVPAPTAQTLYLIFYPPETTIFAAQDAGASCQTFGGYHSEFEIAGLPVPYGVVPDCQGGGLYDTPNTAYAASHEFFEAVTDPLPDVDAGYLDLSYDAWNLGNPGGELCDFCELAAPYQNDGGFFLARVWSNAAAGDAQSDPCLPVPAGEVYQNVTLELPAQIDQTLLGGTWFAQASGQAQSFAFPLSAWSNGAIGGWALTAALAPGATFTPSWSFGSGDYAVAVAPDQNASLTVTVPPHTPSGSYAALALLSGPAPTVSSTGPTGFNFVAIYVQ